MNSNQDVGAQLPEPTSVQCNADSCRHLLLPHPRCSAGLCSSWLCYSRAVTILGVATAQLDHTHSEPHSIVCQRQKRDFWLQIFGNFSCFHNNFIQCRIRLLLKVTLHNHIAQGSRAYKIYLFMTHACTKVHQRRCKIVLACWCFHAHSSLLCESLSNRGRAKKF